VNNLLVNPSQYAWRAAEHSSGDAMESTIEAVDALAGRALWLTVTRAKEGRTACRAYVIYSAEGVALLEGRAFDWRRDIVIRSVTDPGRGVVLLLRRRLLFPFNGKVDVYDERRARIGTVSRSGWFRAVDARTEGRFRDARSLSERGREAVLLGVLDAVSGGEGTVADASVASGFVWLVGNTPVGTLARAELPFTTQTASAPANATPAPPGLSVARLSRMGRRLGRLVGYRAPQGWKLERVAATAPADALLVTAAALFAIELTKW
jgi:hypothetical protein